MRTRRVLIGLVAALLLCACGNAGSGPAGSAGGDERVTILDSSGKVEVRVTTENIWALDEFAALDLLALGVVPDRAAQLYDDKAIQAILTDAGVELVEPDKIELIAAAAPALIVGTQYPTSETIRPRLDEIAPTVIPDVTSSWQDQLAIFATAIGRSAKVAAVVERVEAKLEELATRIADTRFAGATVSLLSAYPGDRFYAYDNSPPLGPLLRQLGFTRPAAQGGTTGQYGFVEVAGERLDEHEADVVISLVGPRNNEASLFDNPLLDTTRSVTAEVVQSSWAGVTPLGAWWVLRDVEAIVLRDGAPATVDDALVLWAELTDNK